MISDIPELLNGYHSRQNYVVSDCSMSGKSSSVRKNAVISYNTIVSNMAISHNPTIISDYGFHSIGCTSVDGYTFANRGSVSDNSNCFFVLEFHILRNSRNNSSRKNVAILPDSCSFHNGYVRSYPGSFSDFYVFMNSRKRVDYHIFGNFCSRMDVC